MCVHTHECVHKNRDHVAHPHSLLLEQKFKRLVFKESIVSSVVACTCNPRQSGGWGKSFEFKATLDPVSKTRTPPKKPKTPKQIQTKLTN